MKVNEPPQGPSVDWIFYDETPMSLEQFTEAMDKLNRLLREDAIDDTMPPG